MDEDYEKAVDEFIGKYGTYAFIDAVRLAIYQTGHRVLEESDLSDIERRTADWLVANFENKLKDFFLADLSWANDQQEREKAFINFFTKRMGKRVLALLPEDIKNYVLANSV